MQQVSGDTADVLEHRITQCFPYFGGCAFTVRQDSIRLTTDWQAKLVCGVLVCGVLEAARYVRVCRGADEVGPLLFADITLGSAGCRRRGSGTS